MFGISTSTIFTIFILFMFFWFMMSMFNRGSSRKHHTEQHEEGEYCSKCGRKR